MTTREERPGLRVGLDYRPALQNREGIGRYTRELVRGMLELQFGPHLGLFGYTLAPKRFSEEELGIAGSAAELVRLRLPSKWLPGLMRRLSKGADDLVGGAHVFHHTQPNLLPVRQAFEVATIFDCIYMLDGGFVDDAAAERMTAAARDAVARAKRILVPSQYVGAEVVMALGAHPDRVSVTELGCDHIARALPPGGYPPAAEPYVLTVTRVDARKNHLRMLTAFEQLVREGLPHRWVVAGPPGHGCEDFEKALANSPARDRVEWRKAVPESELPQLYGQASAFVYASLNEGFGLPPLEAMVCGAPVVASAVTSMPEILGDAAFLVEPTEAERIFEALRRLLVEPDLAEELVRRGRSRARRYTWKECAKHTLLAYQNVLKADSEEPKLRRTL